MAARADLRSTVSTGHRAGRRLDAVSGDDAATRSPDGRGHDRGPAISHVIATALLRLLDVTAAAGDAHGDPRRRAALSMAVRRLPRGSASSWVRPDRGDGVLELVSSIATGPAADRRADARRRTGRRRRAVDRRRRVELGTPRSDETGAIRDARRRACTQRRRVEVSTMARSPAWPHRPPGQVAGAARARRDEGAPRGEHMGERRAVCCDARPAQPNAPRGWAGSSSATPRRPGGGGGCGGMVPDRRAGRPDARTATGRGHHRAPRAGRCATPAPARWPARSARARARALWCAYPGASRPRRSLRRHGGDSMAILAMVAAPRRARCRWRPPPRHDPSFAEVAPLGATAAGAGDRRRDRGARRDRDATTPRRRDRAERPAHRAMAFSATLLAAWRARDPRPVTCWSAAATTRRPARDRVGDSRVPGSASTSAPGSRRRPRVRGGPRRRPGPPGAAGGAGAANPAPRSSSRAWS